MVPLESVPLWSEDPLVMPMTEMIIYYLGIMEQFEKSYFKGQEVILMIFKEYVRT